MFYLFFLAILLGLFSTTPSSAMDSSTTLRPVILDLSDTSSPPYKDIQPSNLVRAPTSPQYSPSTLIIMYDAESFDKSVFDSVLEKYNAEVMYAYSSINGFAIKLNDESLMDNAMTALQAVPGVLSVERDQIMYLAGGNAVSVDSIAETPGILPPVSLPTVSSPAPNIAISPVRILPAGLSVPILKPN